jgi:hypothetical protein
VIAFKVSLNGKHVCTAGVRDFGVVSAIVTWVRRKPEKSRDGKCIEEELTADIGGLDSDVNEHLKWFARRLHVGERITVEVVESDRVDRPKRRRRDDPRKVKRARKRCFERLKKEFEDE